MIKKRNQSSKKVEFSPIFNNKLENAPTDIKIATQETLVVFLDDPNDRSLRNHELTGIYAGVRSIDVTDDWRALYREESERIIFVDLGTHQDLYA